MQDYKQLIDKMIEAGKPPVIVRGALDKHYKQLDKQEFSKKLSDEYDALYPKWGIVVSEEEYLNTTTEKMMTTSTEDSTIILYEIPIVYPEDTPTLQEYINETTIIVEAVDEVLSEDGIVTTEAVMEVVELVRPYVANDVSGSVEAHLDSYIANSKVLEYKAYLVKTDYKVLPDYEPKLDEDIVNIITLRKIARDYIRDNL